DAFADCCPAKSDQSPMRISRAVLRGISRADELGIDPRHEFSQLYMVDYLFVPIALGVQLVDSECLGLDLCIVFGNSQLSMGMKATIIANKLRDLMPHLHRLDRQGHLQGVAAQGAHSGS